MNNGHELGHGEDGFGTMQTTHTSLLNRAQQSRVDPEIARAALNELCVRYWLPVHRFITYMYNIHSYRVRSDEITDLTQGFMVHLLAHGVGTYDPRRGRFRVWLLGAVKNYMRQRKTYFRAQKRDVQRTQSFDALMEEGCPLVEPRYALTPERAFANKVALCAVEDARKATRAWYESRGEIERYNLLERFIPYDELADVNYEHAVAKLGISFGAVRKAACELRERYRNILRARIAQTVPTVDDVDDEFRCLMQGVHSDWHDA